MGRSSQASSDFYCRRLDALGRPRSPHRRRQSRNSYFFTARKVLADLSDGEFFEQLHLSIALLQLQDLWTSTLIVFAGSDSLDLQISLNVSFI